MSKCIECGKMDNLKKNENETDIAICEKCYDKLHDESKEKSTNA